MITQQQHSDIYDVRQKGERAKEEFNKLIATQASMALLLAVAHPVPEGCVKASALAPLLDELKRSYHEIIDIGTEHVVEQILAAPATDS